VSWHPPDPDADLRRARSYVPVIERVLRDTAALRTIEVLLAIGAACPAHTPHDKAIWLAVVSEYDAWIEAPPAARIARIEAAA
jgi:hypothetical protein